MKKIVFRVLMFICMFVTFDVYALVVKPSCPSTAKMGSTITVNVVATRSSGDAKVSAVDGHLSYGSDKLTMNSFVNKSGWTELNGMPNFAVGDISFNHLMSGSSKTLYELKFAVKSSATGNATIRIDGVSATDESGSSISSVSGGSCVVKILSSVNTLSSLSVSGIPFQFSSGTSVYHLNTNLSSVTISGVKTDSKASVSGLGTKSLKYGKNTFSIVVKSESGVSRTYTLNITRNDNRSKVNTLSSLSLSEGSIAFSPSKTSYMVNLDKDVKSVKIGATLTDSKSSFVAGYGPREVSLSGGNNVVSIRVKAENGGIQSYTISINVEDGRSKNADLKSLIVTGYDILFDKSKLNYELAVPFSVEELDVVAMPVDNKAKVTVQNKKLVVGKNDIKILVQAENGTVKTYVIVVDRKKEEIVLSSNNYLKSLDIEGYDLEFKKDIYQYELKVKNTDDLVIRAVSEDDKAKVTVVGNTNIKDGSVVNIAVSAEDGTVKQYDITIKVKKTSIFIYLLIIFIVIGLGVGLFFLIRRMKKADETKIISATDLSIH